MLIHSTERSVEQPLMEKVNSLYQDMMNFYQQYGPDNDNFEDDDEASLMMNAIGILQSPTIESRLEALRLLEYFLSEYCWVEDFFSEMEKQQLLSRVEEVLPKEKRKRQKIFRWVKGFHQLTI